MVLGSNSEISNNNFFLKNGPLAVSSKYRTKDCRYFFAQKLIVSSKTCTANFTVQNTLLQSAVSISQMKLTMKPGEFLFRTEIDYTDLDIRLVNQL